MDEFFNALKSTHNTEKSLRAVEDYIKEQKEKIILKQKADKVNEIEAMTIFEENLQLLNKIDKIDEYKKRCK